MIFVSSCQSFSICGHNAISGYFVLIGVPHVLWKVIRSAITLEVGKCLIIPHGDAIRFLVNFKDENGVPIRSFVYWGRIYDSSSVVVSSVSALTRVETGVYRMTGQTDPSGPMDWGVACF